MTETTATQGRARFGVPMQVGGPLASPDFAAPVAAAARAKMHAELGVRNDQVLALVTSGSPGFDVPDTARALSTARGMVPVAVCGHNRQLRRRCAALPGVVAFGWRTDMAVLAVAADVLVHNAGGMSLTEAVVASLPAVIYAPIAGQGRASAAVLADSGMAPWPQNPDELIATVRQQAARGRVDRIELDEKQQVTTVVAELAYRTWEARRARWLPRPKAGDAAVDTMTRARGISSKKAKRELGWTLQYPSQRTGFEADGICCQVQAHVATNTVAASTSRSPRRRRPPPRGSDGTSGTPSTIPTRTALCGGSELR
ncbi:hypothetical protein GCM10010211_75190 [Streptomyces albospinus]|uniref:Glycosyltransferase n=1 Tax=Streptomyces albospinus TaxID=285515 RepID=A0ABQ2VM89_9ACTN|nr:hypothetical protein GCM10010211_75190 [Streptomyces albospinus]